MEMLGPIRLRLTFGELCRFLRRHIPRCDVPSLAIRPNAGFSSLLVAFGRTQTQADGAQKVTHPVCRTNKAWDASVQITESYLLTFSSR